MIDDFTTEFEQEFLNIEVGEMFQTAYEIKIDNQRDKYIQKCLHYLQHKNEHDKPIQQDNNIRRG